MKRYHFRIFTMRPVSDFSGVQYCSSSLLLFHCQIALITWNSFGEEAGKGCKWVNKYSNTKCLITVLTLNYHGKLLATSVWGVTLQRAETRSPSKGYLSYHTAYQLPYNSVPGVSLRADLDPWINYHSISHKPRSHFSVSHSIKAIPCLSTLSVSQQWSCFSFVS